MVPPYQEQIEKATGRIMVNPNAAPTGTFSEMIPAAGLTPQGVWVPLSLNADGTLPMEGTSGMVHFDDSVTETTPGAEQILIDDTVPVSTTRSLSQVFVNTRVTGTWQVLADGAVIGSGRTGPGGTGAMTYSPMRPLAAGTEYQVTFKSRDNSPPQDVEAYIQAMDTPST